MTGTTGRRGDSWFRALAPIAAWVLLAVLMAQRPGWAADADGAADDLRPGAPNASTTSTGPTDPVAPNTPGAGSGADAAREPAPRVRAASTADSSRALLYVPPSRGAVRHTAGAGTRSMPPRTGASSGAPSAIPAPRARVRVLAPRDHVGLTGRASPTLYWHLTAETTTKVELTVVDDDAVEPVVQLSLPGPVSGGLHALDLAALGVELVPGKTYRWFVALVHDPHRRSKDELAEGAILRTGSSQTGAESGSDSDSEAGSGTRSASPPRSAPSARDVPALATPREEALRAAEQGRFYDALAALSSAIDAAPPDAAALRADRAALLVQASVGVEID